MPPDRRGARQRRERARQIYGLRIPITELDRGPLQRLAGLAALFKTNFDPDEPRIPKGEPGAGQWAYEDGYAEPRDSRGNAEEPHLIPASDSSGEPPPPGTEGNQPPTITTEPPATTGERNNIARQAAEWVRRAIALGARYVPSPQVRIFLRLFETTWWLADNLPSILS